MDNKEYEDLMRALEKEETNFKITIVNPEAIPIARKRVSKLAWELELRRRELEIDE